MKWVRNKNGKRKNLRVGKSLESFHIPQGACSSGKHIFIAYERKKDGKVKIAVYDVVTYKLVKVSKALRVGHANDMVFRDGILYVTHSGTSHKIHTVNAKTLTKGKDITVAGGYRFNGIAREGDGFLLRCMGGKKMLVVDKDFKKIRMFKTSTSFGVSQSMTTTTKYVIRGWASANPTQSRKNYISWYNHNGKLLKKRHLPITGELESVFMVGKELYSLIYRRKKVKGKWKFYAFLLKV